MIVRPEALLEQGPGRWTKERVAGAWAEASRRFRSALADPSIVHAGAMIGIPGAGKTTWSDRHDRDGLVLFDAVWADPRRRAALARRIRMAGKVPIAVWVRTPLPLAIQRNAARPDWRRVPESFVRRAAASLLACPPTIREGWQQITMVDGSGPA